uniref:NADH-ubiquinone oxidoreductase chain 4 n=1 Tax=Sphaeropleales sp. YC001 TaxID=1715688 RepID=A0A0N9HIW4_9CHLO|nr:NADH dehydrogenase subunit 4 [Sphaeropleales sp. YC001]
MWPLVLRMCVLGTVAALYTPVEGSLLLPVLLLPLAGALLLCLLPAKESKKHKVLSLLNSLMTLVLCLRLWADFVPTATDPFQQVVSASLSWGGVLSISLAFGVDSLSLWMVLLTAALMPLAVLCSWNTQNVHSQSFYALLLALESFLFRTFCRLDTLCFYVLYECSLLPMFLLIGLGGSRARKVRAAYLLVLYTLVGSLAMLPCVLLLLSRRGTTDYMLLMQSCGSASGTGRAGSVGGLDSSIVYLLWWGFFLAFAVKVPLMPLHLWLPEAHVERSTAGSVLLRGVLLKLGTYGLLRFNLYLFPERSAYLGPRASTICLIGIVYRSLTTLRMVDLKKVVAYSSVAHMSMVVLAAFSLNEVGIVGSIMTMLAHGVRSPALFLCVGYLYDRTHTKALKYLGGRRTAMPLFSIWFFIFSLCNMRMPLTPNFVGEFLSLCGIFAQNALSLTVSLAGVILSAVYTLWAYARVVHGNPKSPYLHAMADLNRREWWTLRVLALIAVWWGLKPAAVLDSLSVLVYYWGQCTLAVYEPAVWALIP